MSGASLFGAPLKLGATMQASAYLIRCLIGVGISLVLLSASAGEPRTVVALVNGVPITSGELRTELDRLAPSSVAAHGKAADDAAMRKKALDELVVRALAYQAAKRHNLRATAAEMNAEPLPVQFWLFLRALVGSEAMERQPD